MRKNTILLILTMLLPVSVGTMAETRKRKAPNVAVGVNHRSADSLLMSHFNLGLFGNVDTLHGVQTSVFSSVARKEMRGVNIGGLAAFSHADAFGVQMAGFLNGTNGSMRGVQVSGISNIARSMNGVQLAGLSNVSSTPMRGVQLSGITNISMGVKRGIQLAGVANVSEAYMRGLQVAPYN